MNMSCNNLLCHILFQPTTRYRVRPTLMYQQSNQLSIQFVVEHSVQADIYNNNANATVVVRDFLVGVSY